MEGGRKETENRKKEREKNHYSANRLSLSEPFRLGLKSLSVNTSTTMPMFEGK